MAAGEWPVDDNPLRGAPHTAACLADKWDHPYPRELAAYPTGVTPGVHDRKVWPPVRRIDGAHGDRNLVCSCPAPEAFADPGQGDAGGWSHIPSECRHPPAVVGVRRVLLIRRRTISFHRGQAIIDAIISSIDQRQQIRHDERALRSEEGGAEVDEALAQGSGAQREVRPGRARSRRGPPAVSMGTGG